MPNFSDSPRELVCFSFLASPYSQFPILTADGADSLAVFRVGDVPPAYQQFLRYRFLVELLTTKTLTPYRFNERKSYV
jgi:hypothetical protein